MESDTVGTAPRRVYALMVADLFHAGHVALLRAARDFGDEVVVGLLGDDVVASYKRRPIMTLDERVTVVEACRWVDEVIADAPLQVTEEFIHEHRLHALVHGDDLSPEAALAIYGLAAHTDILHRVPYTVGISTTELIGRVVRQSVRRA